MFNCWRDHCPNLSVCTCSPLPTSTRGSRTAHPPWRLFLILAGHNHVWGWFSPNTEFLVFSYCLSDLGKSAPMFLEPLCFHWHGSVLFLSWCEWVIFLLWVPSKFPFVFGFQQSSFDVPGEVVMLGFIVFLEPVVWCLSSWKILHHYLFNIAFVPFSPGAPSLLWLWCGRGSSLCLSCSSVFPIIFWLMLQSRYFS